jgi:hypothetical protein
LPERKKEILLVVRNLSGVPSDYPFVSAAGS